MKIRIKFSKHGAMKFIGHLDIMRYFQKAIRRADLDIVYTEGFSPHMVMSFASPLGVGLTSDGEYFDIEIHGTISSEEAVNRLNHVMVDGIKILSFRQVPQDKANKAMSLVAAADYFVSYRDGKAPCPNWQEKLLEFYRQEQIVIVKKTKKSEKEMDIRPYIYKLEQKEDGVFMQLCAGSVTNIKPELVMEAFAQWLHAEQQPFSLLVHRMEMYADVGTEEKRQFVSLEDLGEEIA
ncbi:MAG: TIGR03936 family radical SAM-associated protein [Eubacteriales bacterium]|nr:TIGR03936 family radical SAM-associated protein [Eubacteriales bacterium]